MSDTAHDRIQISSDVIDRHPLFNGLSPEQRELLRGIFIPCDCYGETMLFRQGDPVDQLYLVVNGEIAITYKTEDGAHITVSRVGKGGVVGWSAALGNRFYTSSAICTEYTQMLRVRGVELREICRENPDTGILILDQLATIIAERLHNTREQVVMLLRQGLWSEY